MFIIENVFYTLFKLYQGKPYTFDAVQTASMNQEAVFDDTARPIVQGLLEIPTKILTNRPKYGYTNKHTNTQTNIQIRIQT